MAFAARWKSERCGEGGASNLYDEVDEPPRRLVREAGIDETGEVEEGPEATSERESEGEGGVAKSGGKRGS